MARGRRRPTTKRPGKGRRGSRERRPRPDAEPLPERDHWIGILEQRGRRARVTPYRDDALWAIAVSRDGLGGARPGDVVVLEPIARARRARGARRSRAEFTKEEARRRGPVRKLPSRGRVVEVLGRPGDAEADFRAVVWRRQLPVAFPPAVIEEAERVGDEPARETLARRVDLRDRPFVTIDPATARDHDDAVCVEPADGGTRLWVAIADVSHYVREGSALDREALRRGNSVYFPDRAIPMLPERLSSDLCSLRPGVDRLAFAVELLVDGKGRVRRQAFFPARVRSRARLVYEDAARVMERGGSGEIDSQLLRLRDLTRALQRRRLAAGSIDFDLPTAEIVLGDDLQPVELVEAPRTPAHRAVEEAMLAANRAVAGALVEAGTPAIFRNHEAPLPRDLEELHELFAGFGLYRGSPEELVDPKTLAAVLARVEGRPEERLVNRVVLRSMRQARYGADCRGHFALAFPHYAHFTSPIRRYADLVVHRALGALLEPDGVPPAHPRLVSVAERLSLRERLAMEAEREMIDLKQCTFMRERVGREYTGHVSGVAPHGLYVTLDEIFVDGLVHVSRLPGYYRFDERAHALVAARGSGRFRLGDPLAIRVASVDPIRAHINFELTTDRPGGRSQSSSSRRSRSSRVL